MFFTIAASWQNKVYIAQMVERRTSVSSTHVLLPACRSLLRKKLRQVSNNTYVYVDSAFTLHAIVKCVSAFGLSNNKWRW